MKAAVLPLLLFGVAAFAESTGQEAAPQLTLDPTLYAEALREVQGLPHPPAGDAPAAVVAEPPAGDACGAMKPGSPTAPGVEDWQAAMRDAGTELADVRLLVLMQRLNPLDPPAARAEDYAEVLRLHHQMLAGNARACLTLARACREGRFANGLIFIRSDALATLLERRAAAFQLPAASPLPEGTVKQPGASS